MLAGLTPAGPARSAKDGRAALRMRRPLLRGQRGGSRTAETFSNEAYCRSLTRYGGNRFFKNRKIF